MNRKAFTLVELVLVMVIAGLILTILFSILTTMPKIKNHNDAKMMIIEQTNNVLEKLNLIIQGYDIDYEEYFNRRQVGCIGSNYNAFTRNTEGIGHCTDHTFYGNKNGRNQIAANKELHDLYFCSSEPEGVKHSADCQNAAIKGYQSYGQYQQLFWDVGRDTDNAKIPSVRFNEVGDSDDRDLGKGPIAIMDSNNIQELYLISADGHKRIFIRRKFIAQREDDLGNTKDQYTLQILKLRGFDAGSDHQFDLAGSLGVFDGKIDTWACDHAEGFLCNGAAINPTLYSGYHLPADNEDGWVNLLNDNISIDKRNIKIIPTKKPEYARTEEDYQINPYIKVSLSTSLTPHLWGNKLAGNILGFSYTLQTLFNTKTFYSK